MRTLESKEEEALSALLSLQVPTAGTVSPKEEPKLSQEEETAAAPPLQSAPEPPAGIKWERVSDDAASAEILSGTQDQPSWDGSEHAFEDCGSEESSTSEVSESRKRDVDSAPDNPSKRIRAQRDGEAAATALDKVKSSHKPARELMSGDLREYFKLPLHVAAQRLKVGTSALKRACRRLGIKSWPYRKLRNINKTIESLQNAQKNTPEHAHAPLKRRIQQLRERYLAIAANGIDASETDDLLGTIDVSRSSSSDLRPLPPQHLPMLAMAHLNPHNTNRPMTTMPTSPRVLNPSIFPIDQVMLNPFRYANTSHGLSQSGASQPPPMYVRQVSYPR